MDLNYMADYISIDLPPAWEHCAEVAMAAYDPSWLEKRDFDFILDYYGLTQDPFYKTRLQQELELLARDETLNRFCWLAHYIMAYAPAEEARTIWDWGKGRTPFAEHGTPTTLVVALLAAQPVHAANMAARGYDAEQIEIHKKGIWGCWVGQRYTYGIDGIRFNLFAWGGLYIRCQLVQLGRLQYEYGQLTYPQYADVAGADAAWINIHIPGAANGLQDDEVVESFRLAAEKAERYFPETAGRTKVFCTSTWLLSPELRDILGPDSNIMRFREHFKVLAYEEATADFLSFGFKTVNSPELDYSTLPEDTSLRRELKVRLLRGDKLHRGFGCFVLP